MKISSFLSLSGAFAIDWIGMHGKAVEDDLCEGLSDPLQDRLCRKFSKNHQTKGFMEAIHTATIQTTNACSVSTIKGTPFLVNNSSNIVRGFTRRLSPPFATMSSRSLTLQKTLFVLAKTEICRLVV